jgi:hypothetical protein
VGSFAVVDSLLTEGERIIGFHEDYAGHHDLGMTVTTGEGSLADGSFVPVAREVLDVMANGMQRFAIYSLDGHLEPAAEEAWVPAGQPGKCMWCHEGHLQGVVEQPTVPPHLPHAAFVAALEEMQGLMSGRRAAIGLDPNGYEAHSWGEQLVQEFNRPSVERVAREWGVAIDEVRSLNLPDEVDPEYPDLGPLLWRRDVDAAAGGQVLAVLPDPRELDPADVDWDAMAALPACP